MKKETKCHIKGRKGRNMSTLGGKLRTSSRGREVTGGDSCCSSQWTSASLLNTSLDSACFCLTNSTLPPRLFSPLPVDVDEEPRRTATAGTLIMKDVNIGDTAVYQCEAKNDHGSILLNTYLYVVGMFPAGFTSFFLLSHL